ncbi:MAG: phosphatase PAP2 family protein [Acidobacteriota bacterium]
MTARLAPLGLAAAVTLLVGIAVSMTPYFAGDVAVARLVQGLMPDAGWAVAVTDTARAPLKYGLMAIAIAACWGLAGWRGAAFCAGLILVEQLGGEASKAVFGRPRPSPDLIAVVGRPSGFSFPSTFVTLYAVTIGTVGLVALRSPASRLRTAACLLCPVILAVAWAARVVPGAHWPSDVVLTTVVCLVWIWALARLALPPAPRDGR